MNGSQIQGQRTNEADAVYVFDITPSSSHTTYSFGHGSGTPCASENSGGSVEGCANSSDSSAKLVPGGSASTSSDALTIGASQSPDRKSDLFFVTNNTVGRGAGITFGDGLRCASGNLIRISVLTPNAQGEASYPAVGSPGIAARGGARAGDVRCYQLWYRDPVGSPCGFGFKLGNGFEVSWQ